MFPFPFSFFGAVAEPPELELIDNNFAMEFNGTDEYISTGSTLTSLGVSTEFSVSFWFKSNDLGLYDTIINAPTSAVAWTSGFGFSIINSKLRFWINQWDDSASFIDTITLSSNTWYHAVGTFNTTDGIKLYLNAGTPGTNTKTTLHILTNPINIGASISSYYFNGDIDEVAIWSRALEAADVTTIYNATNDNLGKCANLWSGGLGTGLVYWNRMGD